MTITTIQNQPRAVALALAALLAACGGTGTFGLTAGDNDPAKLAQAFSRVEAPPAGPINRTGQPMAFLVARAEGGEELIGFDLAAKNEAWRVAGDVSSKVVVGRDFVAYVEGDATLVARDVASGAELWRRPLGGTLVGAAADAERVFVTAQSGKGSKKEWTLTALAGTSGDELWQAESPAALGAPAARGGLVFSPFLKQWLSILDARTGEPITRIRGIDEEITFVRATPEQVYFGSKAGVFLLDERAASGKRDESTYGRAALPEEFVRVHYHWDSFDPIQAGYSAYDRNRILWHAVPADGALAFADQRVVVHTYRFFFGFDATSGDLRWAYNHPRVDVVASAHVGPVIAFASMLGGLGALDPETGTRVYAAEIEGQLLGATFDAAGWSPSEASASDGEPGTAAALASIARDRDARFTDVKKFAVTQLSALEGPEVVRDLLALIQNEKTPPFLHETAVEALVARKDPEALPHLLAALEPRYDYIEGTAPRGVGAVAQAIAAMEGLELGRKQRARAAEALLAHLRAPETPGGDLVHLVRALGAVGGDESLAPLRSFLLVYRADPAFATQVDAVGATIDVLLDRGGRGERELIAFVAADPRTQPGVAGYAVRALEHGTGSDLADEDGDAEGDAKDAPKGEPASAEK